MFAPGNTPREVVNRLYQETARALEADDVRERMKRIGAEPMPMNPEQFDAHVRAEIAANAELVKVAGIKAN